MSVPRAVTFDFGQTLAELDDALLEQRLAERGERIDRARIVSETPAAWEAYGLAKRRGLTGRDAWCEFMFTLLTRAGASSAREHAEWLFDEQPKQNLWRKPIPGMLELARELRARETPVAIVSNSEGRLAELVSELGWAKTFPIIADSGRLGFEKPDPRIFHFAAEQLGVPANSLIHVGDAWEADVVGALEVGARAIWFAPTDARDLPETVGAARSAEQARALLRGHGVL